LPAEPKGFLRRLKHWAAALMRDVLTVWIAARDPRLPWPAKVLALAVAAYALSPIDLIPDIIPALGHLDDLIVVPLGIMAVVRMIPAPMMSEFRDRAAEAARQPTSITGAVLIVMVWLAAAWLATRWIWRNGIIG
jgi:uncharacterized membrane protein YkvA (DUF1232 family)